jgi:hypothetical protein
MNRETFNDGLGWLEQFHSCKVSSTAREQYFRSLEKTDGEAFSRCVTVWCERAAPHPHQFPTIDDLRAVLDELYQQDWQRKKNKENRRPFTNPPRHMSEEAKKAFDLFYRFALPGKDKIGREEFLAEIEKLGFAEQPKIALLKK